MTTWPDKLFIYEVNTWVWLSHLSQRYNRAITLANVPAKAIESLARPNVDVIWMMGVWKRSEYARAHALKYKHEYVRVLPDAQDDDIIGSAYSIAEYEVDERLGGREGLAAFRQQLAKRGLRLILDYVPNHIAVDHAWVHKHPKFIVRGKVKDLNERRGDFFRHSGSNSGSTGGSNSGPNQQFNRRKPVLAHGRDPYFPGWTDTAQLNAFNPDLRQAVRDTLLDIASQCDGVRCDMAMLMMNEIFANTWNGYVGKPPLDDYWPSIIPAVKAHSPEFLFIAEVYWGREWAIIQQGFDYAYDKTLYDRIVEGDVQKIRQHLVAHIDFQKHLVRFIENHDEPRAYQQMGPEKSFPAATLICTLPGACLLHDGQLSGYQAKLPVQIRRGPAEREDTKLFEHYLKLLRETRDPIYQHGEWYLFELKPAGPHDTTYRNLLAYGWRERGKAYRLIVVNLTATKSYARLPCDHWNELKGQRWRLHDVDDGAVYERNGDEMLANGLFIELHPYESHVFRFERKTG